MRIERSAIPDVLIVRPVKHPDARGFFSETFKATALEQFGVKRVWSQDNHSYTARRSVVRGLHFQAPPHAQAKLVRVIRGAIYDVAVDIRRSSPTYGRHVALELSAENWTQILIPEGFAHGLATLTDNTEVLYKVSADYMREAEGGLLWNDPDLGIAWPISDVQLDPRDLTWPRLRDLASPFD
jgi:dTDP-4-dehydrorhamnose 3,5-epimerase